MHSVEEIKINPEPQDASDAKEKSKLGTEKWSWQRTTLTTMLEEHRDKKECERDFGIGTIQVKPNQAKPNLRRGGIQKQNRDGMG